MLNDWRIIPLEKNVTTESLSKDLTVVLGPPGDSWFIFDSHLYLKRDSKQLTWYMLKYGEIVR